MILKNRYIRIVAIVLAVCLLLLLAIWAGAGPIAKPQVVKYLKTMGAETATIQSIIFNPFRPSLQIKGLEVNADKGQPLYLERVYVRLSWFALLRKEVRVRSVEIQKLNLKVHQTTETMVIGGLKLPSRDTAQQSTRSASQPSDWHLRLDDLVISSSRVDLAVPDFAGTLALDQVHFQNGVLGETVVLGALDLKGRLNEATLRISTQVDIQKGKGALNGRLDLEQLKLAAFQDIAAKAVSQLKGKATIQTQWQLDIDGTVCSLNQSVDIKLADIRVDTPDVILAQEQGDIQVKLVARAREQKVETVHIQHLTVKDAHLAATLKKKPPEPEKQAPRSGQPAKAEATAAKLNSQPPAVGIKVDKVEVAGDTRISFADRNLDPPFSEQMRSFNFTISDLDNQQLNNASPFTLSAEIQKYGKLNFSGTVKPFSQDLYMDMTGRIAEYGLPSVSGYTNSMLGYNIRTGQLNADVDLKIENRLLKGRTKFDFQALKLIPSAEKAAAKVTKQATMPLDLALGYISDDKGNLKLKVPIEGSLDDPQFGLSHLCQIVMVKAAKSAAYGYLKNVLLPYGALLQIGADVALKAGKEMFSLKLVPLVYPPGKVQAGPESKAYIDQLVALMAKEPGMRLIICGVATPADFGPTPPTAKISEVQKEKQLLDLARTRMDMFKRMLIETHGIASSRLLDCYPKVDKNPDGQPRIEIDL